MSILINDGNLSDENVEKCDIGEFVVLVEHLKMHISSISKGLQYGRSVLHWQRPWLSMCWMLSITYLLFVNPVYILILVLLPLPPFMTMELIRTCGKRVRTKKTYKDCFQRKDDEYQQLLKYETQLQGKEHLNAYLEIITILQRLFYEANSWCNFVKSIIQWKRPWLSFLLLAVVLVAEFSLYLFDIRYVLLSVVLLAFVVNKYLYRAILHSFSKLSRSASNKLKSDRKKSTVIVSSTFAKEPVQDDVEVEDLLDTSSSSDTDDDIVDSKKLVTSSGMETVPAGSSVVAKFFSRKRYRLKTGAGTCSNCDQPSSSILNKRRYCRHCGKSFCARCCYKRVPRSLLGATAPAAYQEKVLVCTSCHVFVSNRIKPQTEIIE